MLNLNKSMWEISQNGRSGRVEHANTLIFLNLCAPGKSKNYHFQSIMPLFEWPIRQTGGFLQAPFPSLCLSFFFLFLFLVSISLIDISQQKENEEFSETSQCKRSIKSGQLQVTPNQRKQLMQHLPGCTYVPLREWTPLCPQNPRKGAWHVKPGLAGKRLLVPRVRTCHRRSSFPSHCTSITVGDDCWPPGVASGSPNPLPTARAGLLGVKFCKEAAVSLTMLELGPIGRAKLLNSSVWCCTICFPYWGSDHSGGLQRSRNALFSL